MRKIHDLPLTCRKVRVNIAIPVLVALFTMESLCWALAPTYLADMPTVAEVRAKIHGSDPIDTAVRQDAAFGSLCALMQQTFSQSPNGTPHAAPSPQSPEETALCKTYTQAAGEGSKTYWASLPKFGNDSWAMRRMRYSADGARGLVLDAFPRVDKLYNERKGLAQASVGGRNAPALVGWLLIAAIGLAVTFGAGVVVLRAAHVQRSLLRYEFHHRSSSGVVQFDTFENAEAHKFRWARVRALYQFGVWVLSVGLVVLGFGLLGSVLLLFFT